jgi:hypothetical protein
LAVTYRNWSNIMSALRVLTSEIRQLDGLYSLNDLHKAAGSAAKHKPGNFMRVDTTTALMEEIRCSDVSIIPAKTIRGRGKPQGTYACKELVYAYAMWVSPSFHLRVIRAFDAMQQPAGNPEQPPLGAFVAMHSGIQSLAGQRFLVSFNEDGTGYGASPVPRDCCVMTTREFIKALGDPNGFFFDNQMLTDLLAVVARRIPARIKYLAAMGVMA